MGFFKDFKRDFAQAVNELMPDKDELANEYDDEDMVNTFDDNDNMDIAPEDMIDDLDDFSLDIEKGEYDEEPYETNEDAYDNYSDYDETGDEASDENKAEDSFANIPQAEMVEEKHDVSIDNLVDTDDGEDMVLDEALNAAVEKASDEEQSVEAAWEEESKALEELWAMESKGDNEANEEEKTDAVEKADENTEEKTDAVEKADENTEGKAEAENALGEDLFTDDKAENTEEKAVAEDALGEDLLTDDKAKKAEEKEEEKAGDANEKPDKKEASSDKTATDAKKKPRKKTTKKEDKPAGRFDVDFEKAALEAVLKQEEKKEDKKEDKRKDIYYQEEEKMAELAQQAADISITEKEQDIENILSDDTTYITKGTTIKGNIITEGGVDLIGTVEGDVDCKGKLIIGGSVKGTVNAGEIYANAAKIEGETNSEGSVKIGVGSVVVGNINATSAVIAGAVNGDIDVKGPVIVDSTAVIMGNIKSRSVQINNGAVIEGFCSQCYSEIDVKSFFE